MTRIYTLLLGLSALIMSSCRSTPPPTKTMRTFIVYYDPTVGNEPLLQRCAQEKWNVLYRYENFKAVALQVPTTGDVRRSIRQIERIKGVLSVQEDQVMELH